MDLGATICTPKSAACGLCPWRLACRARAAGTVDQLPRKLPKAAKPVRHGVAYLARRADGAWLLERRPESGLLGGMLGWPGSDWVDISTPRPETPPPCAADWRTLPGEVRHTFTHFHLRLALRFAGVPHGTTASRGMFLDAGTFRPSDLPTVMRKAFDLVP